MGASFGIAGMHWQQRVNWERLRKYRLERARERSVSGGTANNVGLSKNTVFGVVR